MEALSADIGPTHANSPNASQKAAREFWSRTHAAVERWHVAHPKLAQGVAFVAVIVGGVGSLRGAIAGGLALGLVESLGLWKIPTEWQSSIAFIVLFLVVLLRPQGLFGRAVS